MDKLHELKLDLNSAIYELKGLRKEGAWPVHIGQCKKKIRELENQISFLEDKME
jgi:hypothetical protein